MLSERMLKVNKKLSVVVSCYNEEQVLDQFYSACIPVLESLQWDYELIFVNDGSSDDSYCILKRFAKENEKVRLISLSRNFGHEAAMIAGIDCVEGDGIICMDADLQHPTESIPDIVDMLDKGYDVVSMIRKGRKESGVKRRFTSWLFYKTLNTLSSASLKEYSSDYFAISKRAAHVLRTEYRERVRYLRGYVQNIGFRCGSLEYEEGIRKAGKSHYSIPKLLNFSVTALCGFTDVPLKLGIYTGLIAALSGVILIIYSIIMKAVYGAPSGYTTIVVALCFLFSLTLIVLGIMGEYISVLLREVKGRPIYIIEETINMEK